MDPAGLAALERELTRIPEITAARVVADDGVIVEVHILSTPTKHAKQVVRDVQSVAMATFGLDIDRRVVSVVQLDAVATTTVEPNGTELGEVSDVSELDDEGDEATPEPEPALHLDDEDELEDALEVIALPLMEERIRIENVAAVRNGTQCMAQVVLSRGADRATGMIEGLSASSSIPRLVAHATVSALRQLEPAAARIDVESANLVSLNGRSTAVTTVVIVVPPYEEVVAGAAMVHGAGELDAVARAVLDATNRRLPQLR